jgi:hypothetical protein
MEGSGQVPFLLAERARSECARSMRAVKGSLGHSPKVRLRESDGARLGEERVSARSRGRVRT